ncbi:MAG: cellulase family glycosylhydrolase, partial [Planctomycetia bacterium]|nr:cellulase family glycosylhydrolase [Planctomycetia bacterium]
EMGPERAEYFFDRWLDHFFTEDDVVFMKQAGATAVRIPLNYRHFEHDAAPFEYVEKGFERLGRALDWCARHGLYAILDLHAVQGYHNYDWHSDNATNHSLFWQHPHFQDRFVALWEEFARRYKDHAAIGGYNVMNEPVSGQENNPGPYHSPRPSNWDLLNAVYRRVVEAIRAIDPHHMVFLDGDHFSGLFEGLDAPFADNLVYCFHWYMPPAMGPGPYPGKVGGQMWDRAKMREGIVGTEGYKYAKKHGVPLCCGEFGALFTGPAGEKPDRIRGAGDQADVLEELDIHWTTVTYKDVGHMGWAMTDPESPFMQAIRPVLDAKRELQAVCWGTLAPGAASEALGRLAEVIKEHCPEPDLDAGANEAALRRYALVGYAAGLLQTPFARCFKEMSEAEMDEVLQSFRIENCIINRDFLDVLKTHMQK